MRIWKERAAPVTCVPCCSHEGGTYTARVGARQLRCRRVGFPRPRAKGVLSLYLCGPRISGRLMQYISRSSTICGESSGNGTSSHRVQECDYGELGVTITTNYVLPANCTRYSCFFLSLTASTWPRSIYIPPTNGPFVCLVTASCELCCCLPAWLPRSGLRCRDKSPTACMQPLVWAQSTPLPVAYLLVHPASMSCRYSTCESLQQQPLGA